MSEGAAIERSSLPNDEADPVRGFKVAVANVGAPFLCLRRTCTHRQCPLSKGELEHDGYESMSRIAVRRDDRRRAEGSR
jgi:nitrite reductase/ring-hydroxylating ferredoxin subunit